MAKIALVGKYGKMDVGNWISNRWVNRSSICGVGVGIPVVVVTTVGGFAIGSAVDLVRSIFK